MKSTPQLELVECIYDCGFDHQDWNQVLKKLCDLVNAKSAGLFFINFHENEFRVLGQHGLPESFTPSYQLSLGTQDITATIMRPLAEGTALAAVDHNVSKLEHPSFYTSLLLPHQVGYISALNIYNNERYFVGIGIHRGMDQTQLDDKELAMLEKLYPHFRRVFNFSDLLEQLKKKEDSLSSALSRIPLGVMIVDEKLQPTYMNELASVLIQKRLGLQITDGTLKAVTRSEQISLQSKINKMLQDGTVATLLQVKQDAQTNPLTIMFGNPAPSSPIKQIIKFTPNQVVLYLSHPELCSFATVDSLQEAYQLTVSEAQIALSLTNGLTLQTIAKDKNVSIQTVRSQLKSVFNKMNVNSQTELVRYILTSALNLTK